MFIRGLIVLGVLSLFIYPFGTSLAKPLPPEGLGIIIEQLGELEESYEGEKWDEAAKIVFEIEEELNNISGSIPANDQIDFSNSLKGLHYGITEKDEELTEDAFIRLKNSIFQFSDHFQYDTHPIFTIIDKYIGEEAVEAAESGNFDGVISEIREVANILKNSQHILIDNGATQQEIKEFHKKLNAVVVAARNKDKMVVQESLETAKKYFSNLSS